jgi:predicted translin family RNA/ssDNA-binding protein
MKVIQPMYETIQDRFAGILVDLEGINAYRYQNNVTGGVQEYMEAVLLHHYLETEEVLSHAEASAKMPHHVMLTEEDYLLGVFDFTGEVMRFLVTYMATNAKLPGGKSLKNTILADMHSLRCNLEGMNVAGHRDLKSFGSKMSVARNSLDKIQKSVYGMTVRGQEKPEGWAPDVNESRGQPVELESY